MAEGSARPASDPRRMFGVLTLSALAVGTLVAVAGSRAAVSVEAADQPTAMVSAGAASGDALTMPLVTSLALVVLAAWGVLLLARGWVRRSAAVLALLASGGAVVAAVLARGSLHETVEAALAEVGASGTAEITGWYLAALVGAADLTLTSALAVWLVPGWPEMGRRYDAPAAPDAGTPFTHDADSSALDLWRAMDEGRDPTDPGTP